MVNKNSHVCFAAEETCVIVDGSSIERHGVIQAAAEFTIWNQWTKQGGLTDT